MKSGRARKSTKAGAGPVGVQRQAALVIGMFLSLMVAPKLVQSLLPQRVIDTAVFTTARASAWLISGAGIPAIRVGNRIYLTNHVFRIDPACSGLIWLVLFALTVLLVPVEWRRKRQGLLIGLPALLAFNLFRIVTVAFVSEHWPAQFTIVHDVVMQSAFVVVALAVWLFWMWISRNDWKPGWA